MPAYFALLLALEGTMIGVFAAADVFLFYVFFEVMLVPMYFLIGSLRRPPPPVRGGEVLPLLAGRRPVHAGRGDRAVGSAGTLRLARRWSTATSIPALQRWLFLGFFLAFAIKAPFFPFHTWLPDAGGAAPAAAAALLVGVLDKVGTFGILRYCLPLFPEASRYFAPLALALAVIGIIYAALLAVGQNDLKRLVAYTSVAHFGFIGIGIFAFTTQAAPARCSTWSTTAWPPACCSWWSACSWPGAARPLVSRLRRRRQAACRCWPACSSSPAWPRWRCPGLAPFVSEFLVLIGTFTRAPGRGGHRDRGIILAAAYVLWMVQRTTQGTLNPALRDRAGHAQDLVCAGSVVVAPLIALILFLGFYPKPVLDVINPAVHARPCRTSGRPTRPRRCRQARRAEANGDAGHPRGGGHPGAVDLPTPRWRRC